MLRATRWPAPVRGMLWMLLAALASGLMNGLIRSLSSDIHAFEIAFFRNLFGLLVLMPLLVRAGPVALRTRQFRLHALRGLLNAGAMLTFFYAVAITPLATVAALSFTSPLFATVLAGLILREWMNTGRIGGLVLGFLGALVILRPGITTVTTGEILIVISSAMWAAALIDIKLLSRTESSLTITLYAAMFLTPITLAFALPFWTWPTTSELVLLVGVGMLGSMTQLSVAQAFREADASQVLPGDFTKLIWAALIGYLAFGERPDMFVLGGAALIFVGVGLVTYAGARRVAPGAAPPLAPPGAAGYGAVDERAAAISDHTGREPVSGTEPRP